MTTLDLRGSWPCALCDQTAVAKRGTICADCLERREGRTGLASVLEAGDTQLTLDWPVSTWREWQDVDVKGGQL